MKLCSFLVIVGLILLLDGFFGFLRRAGIPITQRISAPLGFILLIGGAYLSSVGYC